MMDLINRTELLRHLDECIAEGDAQTPITNAVLLAIKCAVEQMPRVDAVPVRHGRCKDCRYWGDEDGFLTADDGRTFCRCTIHNYMIDGMHTGWCPKENDFCSIYESKDEVSE